MILSIGLGVLKMDRKIAWEKWWDQNLDYEDHEPVEDEEYEEHSDPTSLMFTPINFMPQKISTPVGEFDPEDPLCPTNMFDCWVGHTNFRLSSSDLDKISNTDGVECFEQITPYRFFIGVGKMFNFVTVYTLIQKDVCHTINDPEFIGETPDFLNNVFSNLSEAFTKIGDDTEWAVYIGPYAEIIAISPKQFGSYEDYEKEVNDLYNRKEGNIITGKTLNGV